MARAIASDVLELAAIGVFLAAIAVTAIALGAMSIPAV